MTIKLDSFRVYYTTVDFHVVSADSREDARRVFARQFPGLKAVSVFDASRADPPPLDWVRAKFDEA